MIYLYSPPHWHWITFSGNQAQDFLHRITTIPVKSLIPGQGATGYCLSPQGKVRACFTLWALANNTFAFEFDGGQEDLWKTQLLNHLEQYTFSETFLTEEPPLQCQWIFSQNPTEDLLQHFPSELHHHTNPLQICRHPSQPYFWASLWGTSTSIQAYLNQLQIPQQQLSQETLETWRIQAGIPKIDHEITSQVIPLELHNLSNTPQRCYPGQEVIERILSQGSPPRLLVQITGPWHDALCLPLELSVHDQTIGTVTSLCRVKDTFLGLGLIKKTFAKQDLSIHLKNTIELTGKIQLLPRLESS